MLKRIVTVLCILSLLACLGCDDDCDGQIDEGCQWNKTVGGIGWDGVGSVIQGNGGGYVIAGITESYGAGSSDAWVLKIDEDGNEQWNKTYGGTDNDGVSSLISGNNGGYVIAGGTSSYGTGVCDGSTGSEGLNAWIIKTDENGNAPTSPSNEYFAPIQLIACQKTQ